MFFITCVRPVISNLVYFSSSVFYLHFHLHHLIVYILGNDCNILKGNNIWLSLGIKLIILVCDITKHNPNKNLSLNPCDHRTQTFVYLYIHCSLLMFTISNVCTLKLSIYLNSYHLSHYCQHLIYIQMCHPRKVFAFMKFLEAHWSQWHCSSLC